MRAIDRRHRGRAIRRAHRRNGPNAGVAFANITPDFSGFGRAVERAAKSFGDFSLTFSRAPYAHPRQILHNGRKARR